MAILQGLLTLISRSVGKVLNAIFGWAVRALFGQPTAKEQPFLTGVVAAAAAWPVLLVGIAFPKVTTLIIAFVPFHNRVPPLALRLGWLTLAVIVPIVVGLAVATKAPAGSLREPIWMRILRGWPITIGLAAAFLLMFVTVPALKVASAIRRRRDEQVPLITHSSDYHDVAAEIVTTLNRHGFALEARKPSWWVAAPTKILLVLGGDAFRGYVPSRLAYFREPSKRGLEAAFYPNGLLLRGEEFAVVRAHGLACETASHTGALQTTDLAAQALEKRIHGLWALFDRDQDTADADTDRLLPAILRLADDLSVAKVPFVDWQILYRELLQLDRALRGHGQLIAREQPGHHLPEAPAAPLP